MEKIYYITFRATEALKRSVDLLNDSTLFTNIDSLSLQEEMAQIYENNNELFVFRASNVVTEEDGAANEDESDVESDMEELEDSTMGLRDRLLKLWELQSQ